MAADSGTEPTTPFEEFDKQHEEACLSFVCSLQPSNSLNHYSQDFRVVNDEKRENLIKIHDSTSVTNGSIIKEEIQEYSPKDTTNSLNGYDQNFHETIDEKDENLLKNNESDSSVINGPTANMAKTAEEKFRQQQLEASRRENVLVMRLTTKEQEVQEYLTQLEELRAGLTGGGHIKNTLLDPAVNLLFQRMKSELEQTKEKLEQSVQEFDAWKFTPDSQTGKRLMAKCRMLIQENEELGKMTSSGRIAKLEGDLAVSRKLSDELKNSQTDIDAFLLELDESMEAMQSTTMGLQQRIDSLLDENQRLKRRLVEAGLDDTMAGASCQDDNVGDVAVDHRTCSPSDSPGPSLHKAKHCPSRKRSRKGEDDCNDHYDHHWDAANARTLMNHRSSELAQNCVPTDLTKPNSLDIRTPPPPPSSSSSKIDDNIGKKDGNSPGHFGKMDEDECS